jgi:hypothetical protein
MPVTARVGTDVVGVLPLTIAGVALLAIGKFFGGPLALPMLSIALLGAGFVIAAALYFRRRSVPQQTAEPAWLIAGALVLVGFAAALLSDGDGALVALDGLHSGLTLAAGN